MRHIQYVMQRSRYSRGGAYKIITVPRNISRWLWNISQCRESWGKVGAF